MAAAAEEKEITCNFAVPDSLIDKLCDTGLSDEKNDSHYLQELLKGLECPFTWNFHELPLDIGISINDLITVDKEDTTSNCEDEKTTPNSEDDKTTTNLEGEKTTPNFENEKTMPNFEDEKTTPNFEDEKTPNSEDEKTSNSEDEKTSNSEDEEITSESDDGILIKQRANPNGHIRFTHHGWTNFIIRLFLSFLFTNEGKYNEAKKIINVHVEFLQKLTNEDCKDPMFYRIKNALLHLTFASLLYTHAKSNIKDKEETDRIKNKIPSISDMSDADKAAMYAMKAVMLINYNRQLNHLILENAEKATDLDPTMAEWWHLVGEAQARIRKMLGFTETVKRKEIEAFEKAVELDPNPTYMISLGDAYRFCASRLFKKFLAGNKDIKLDVVDSFNRKASEIYKKTWRTTSMRLTELCTLLDGFMSLPKNFMDPFIVEPILLECLKLDPDKALSQYLAGKFYSTFHELQDYKKALHHLEKAENLRHFFSATDLIKIRTEMNFDYDPYEDLLKYLNKYKREIHQIQFFCHLGSYFLFKKRDIIKAIEYYTTVMKRDRVTTLKTNYVLTLPRTGPIDLLKIATDEARLVLETSNSLSETDKITLREFVDTVNNLSPETTASEPERYQIENFIEKSINKMKKTRTQYLQYPRVHESRNKYNQQYRSDNNESRSFQGNSTSRGGYNNESRSFQGNSTSRGGYNNQSRYFQGYSTSRDGYNNQSRSFQGNSTSRDGYNNDSRSFQGNSTSRDGYNNDSRSFQGNSTSRGGYNNQSRSFQGNSTSRGGYNNQSRSFQGNSTSRGGYNNNYSRYDVNPSEENWRKQMKRD